VSLEGQFDLDGYLTPYSDIVALMVLEHQAHFANLVTRATWETRLGETMRIAEAAEALADYMLFVDEAKIPGGGIEGSSGFAEKFSARAQGCEGSIAARARSEDAAPEISAELHDLFAGVPGHAGRAEESRDGKDRARAVRRDQRPKYAHLTPNSAAIREILQSTVERRRTSVRTAVIVRGTISRSSTRIPPARFARLSSPRADLAHRAHRADVADVRLADQRLDAPVLKRNPGRPRSMS
jgi:hypothetical protein